MKARSTKVCRLMWLSAINTRPDTPQSSGLDPEYLNTIGSEYLGHAYFRRVNVKQVMNEGFILEYLFIFSESVNYQVHFISYSMIFLNSNRAEIAALCLICSLVPGKIRWKA